MTKPLTEIIPWRKTIWTCGFLKTTLSGALISTGVVLIFNGITAHPIFVSSDRVELVSGFIAVIIAIFIITSIDRFKEKTKKEELETIDRQIDERAREIAEEKVLEFLNKIEQSQDE